jgi:hypothetical protein
VTAPSRSGQAASARWRVSSGGECRWIGVPAASTRRRRRSVGGLRPRFDRRVDDHALTRAIARAVASWGGGSDMESSRRGTRIQVGGRIRASQAGRRREYRRRRREYGVAQAWHRRGRANINNIGVGSARIHVHAILRRRVCSVANEWAGQHRRGCGDLVSLDGSQSLQFILSRDPGHILVQPDHPRTRHKRCLEPIGGLAGLDCVNNSARGGPNSFAHVE